MGEPDEEPLFQRKLNYQLNKVRKPGVGRGEGGSYSNAQVAEAIGVSAYTVHKLRHGLTKNPKASIRRSLEKLLEVKTHKWLDDDVPFEAEVQPPDPHEPVDPEQVAIAEAMTDAGVRAFFRSYAELDAESRRFLLDVAETMKRRRADDAGTSGPT